jgi:sulfate adenylyltransferase subunit 1
MDLLRFITAGSVDNGKSTLIGRLLYDSKVLLKDQIAAVESASQKRGKEKIDLAMFTDGLKEERELGITIDVAYRYFSTPKRKFIIADTPGHEEYTRNMVTGASTADVALILIDATKGLTSQTFRHTIITSMLNLKHIIVCVNKMDLINFSESAFEKIKTDYVSFFENLDTKPNIIFIPISALEGDNIVDLSVNMAWYKGKTLVDILETISIHDDLVEEDNTGIFSVQMVLNKQNCALGIVTEGVFHEDDKVVIYPSKKTAEIKHLFHDKKHIKEISKGMYASIELDNNSEIDRGDTLVGSKNKSLYIKSSLRAKIVWLNENEFRSGKKYLIKQITNEQECFIDEVFYKYDSKSLLHKHKATKLCLNDIAEVSIKTSDPIVTSKYKINKATGSFLLIDPETKNTAAAGVIL